MGVSFERHITEPRPEHNGPIRRRSGSAHGQHWRGRGDAQHVRHREVAEGRRPRALSSEGAGPQPRGVLRGQGTADRTCGGVAALYRPHAEEHCEAMRLARLRAGGASARLPARRSSHSERRREARGGPSVAPPRPPPSFETRASPAPQDEGGDCRRRQNCG